MCNLSHAHITLCTCEVRRADVIYFFSFFPAVNERATLLPLGIQLCTLLKSSGNRNATSCRYRESGYRMAWCLPQVDGNWSGKYPVLLLCISFCTLTQQISLASPMKTWLCECNFIEVDFPQFLFDVYFGCSPFVPLLLALSWIRFQCAYKLGM